MDLLKIDKSQILFFGNFGTFSLRINYHHEIRDIITTLSEYLTVHIKPLALKSVVTFIANWSKFQIRVIA